MATETNNLKLSKADSSDAIIQTLYANNNNLDIIDENISNLKTESDTKATKSELAVLTERVSDKADISYVDGIAIGLNSTMDNKADTSYVGEEVAKLNTAISGKADISYVDSKEFTLPVATADTLGGIKVGANLAIDSDGTLRAIATSSGDSGDMLKSVYDTNNNGIVDNSEKLGGQLPSYYAKAADLTSQINSVNTAVSGKADTTYVDTELNKKASTTYVDTELNKKASTTYVDNQVSTLNTAISGKQSKLTFDSTPTDNSSNPVTSAGIKTYIDNSIPKTITASSVTAGTFTGEVVASPTATAASTTAQVRNIQISTTDLTAGTSSLTTGKIYLVYE